MKISIKKFDFFLKSQTIASNYCTQNRSIGESGERERRRRKECKNFNDEISNKMNRFSRTLIYKMLSVDEIVAGFFPPIDRSRFSIDPSLEPQKKKKKKYNKLLPLNCSQMDQARRSLLSRRDLFFQIFRSKLRKENESRCSSKLKAF